MPRIRIFAVFLREWRLPFAAAALLSVALFLALGPSPRLRLDRREVRLAREADDPREAELRLERFLEARPRSRLVPEAEYLLARLRLTRAAASPAPTEAEIDRAWRGFSRAEAGGYDRDRCNRGLVRAAYLLLNRGFERRAITRLRDDLWKARGREEVLPDVAYALAVAPSGSWTEPARMVREYLPRVGGDARARALEILARILWRHDRFSEMAEAAALGEREFPTRLRFRLDRAKAFARSGRDGEALPLLAAIRKESKEADLRDEAAYFEAEIRMRRSRATGESLARRLARSRTGTVSAAALLLLGWARLEGRMPGPYPLLIEGLRRVRFRAELLPYRPRLAALHRKVLGEGKRVPEAEKVWAVLTVLEELRRLENDPVSSALEIAHVAAERGRDLIRRAARAEGERLLVRAGRTYAGIAGRVSIDRDFAAQSRLLSAEAYFDGSDYVRAADQFRLHFRALPSRHILSLFREGEALARAGIYLADGRLRRGALGVLAEYLQEARPGAPKVPESMVLRGKILFELGRFTEAIGELVPFLRESHYGIDPRDPLWRKALLIAGRAHVERAVGSPEAEAGRRSRVEAHRLLREYLVRYAEGPGSSEGLPGGAVDAAFALARLATLEGDVGEALRALERMERFVPRLSQVESRRQERKVREGRFVLGDLLFQMGRYSEAQRIYESGLERYPVYEERMWGLVGRARCLLRLRGGESAAGAVEEAKRLYERRRRELDISLDGQGRIYWPQVLLDLQDEAKKGG